MTSNILTGKEAQAKILSGVNTVVDAVKVTLGAQGANAVLEHQLYPFAITTNDGVSIAKAIELEDPYERLGANLVKEIASRAEKQTGDGTTTTAVLLQAILREGVKADAQPMEVLRSINECLPLIEEAVNAQKKEITIDDVATVATVSAEDPTIGAMIQEIYQQIGKDGLIFRDVSKTGADHYSISTGVRIIDSGWASPYMCDMDEQQRFIASASAKNPAILITRQKLMSAKDIEALCQTLSGNNQKELIIFADEYEPNVVTELVMTRAARGFRATVVKMPTLWRDHWINDLALLTGAKVIDPALGLSLKAVRTSDLGTCGQFIATKDEVYLDGVLDVSEHVAKLLAEGDDESSLRAARLNTKTARYFVGAMSDQALSYRRLKVDDAAGTAHEALQHGIVPGGGVALLNASRALPDTIGGKILKKALKAPIAQIMANAGISYEEYQGLTPAWGYDAKSDSFKDMFDAGIVDATSVVLSAIRNALSVAAVVLSARVLVVLPKTDAAVQPRMPMM